MDLEQILIQSRDLLSLHAEGMGEDRDHAEALIQQLNAFLAAIANEQGVLHEISEAELPEKW